MSRCSGKMGVYSQILSPVGHCPLMGSSLHCVTHVWAQVWPWPWPSPGVLGSRLHTEQAAAGRGGFCLCVNPASTTPAPHEVQ